VVVAARTLAASFSRFWSGPRFMRPNAPAAAALSGLTEGAMPVGFPYIGYSSCGLCRYIPASSVSDEEEYRPGSSAAR
jgi:hypothetical protein